MENVVATVVPQIFLTIMDTAISVSVVAQKQS